MRQRFGDHIEVESLVDQLSTLGIREDIPTDALRGLFQQKKYADMLGVVKDHYQLGGKFILGKVRSGGPRGAPAWVEREVDVHGCLFFTMKATVYMRCEFLDVSSFHTVVMAMAHECAHIVLHSLYHPLGSSERAVDVTAMVLGFSEFYLVSRGAKIAHLFSGEIQRPEVQNILAAFRILVPFAEPRYGYLTDEEILTVVRLIRERRAKT